MGVIYSDDQMTQFLDQFIPNTITFLVSKEGDSKIQIKTANKIKEVYRLLGRFCDFKSYVPMIFSSLRVYYYCYYYIKYIIIFTFTFRVSIVKMNGI